MKKSIEDQLKHIDSLKDEDIVYDYDSPETDESFWANAQVVKRNKKETHSMRFDPDLYAWFKKQAKTEGLPTQTLMHRVLETYKVHKTFEESGLTSQSVSE